MEYLDKAYKVSYLSGSVSSIDNYIDSSDTRVKNHVIITDTIGTPECDMNIILVKVMNELNLVNYMYSKSVDVIKQELNITAKTKFTSNLVDSAVVGIITELSEYVDRLMDEEGELEEYTYKYSGKLLLGCENKYSDNMGLIKLLTSMKSTVMKDNSMLHVGGDLVNIHSNIEKYIKTSMKILI